MTRLLGADFSVAMTVTGQLVCGNNASRTTIESTDIAGLLDLTYVTVPEVNIGVKAMLSVLLGTGWLLWGRRAVRA